MQAEHHSSVTRRQALGSAAAVGGWLLAGSQFATASPAGAAATAMTDHTGGPYALPPLPYDYAALEPHLDAQTMKLHHDIHHAGYVRKANAAVSQLADVRATGGDSIQRVKAITQALQFNLSGHLLHSMFWETMAQDGGPEPDAELEIAGMIKRDFGSMRAFTAHFQAASAQVEGSGWGILAYEPISDRLLVLQVEKQQNSAVLTVPLMGVDVWEHAYYLKYQNRRSAYIKAFMNVINWKRVDERFRAARNLHQMTA